MAVAAIVAGITVSGPTPARGAVTLEVPGVYPTIAAAVAVAEPGDTVLVSPGTYEGTFTITEPIRVMSTDGPATTVLDGNNLPLGMMSRGSLSGFTLTNSWGGIYLEGFGAHIHDNVFRGNWEGLNSPPAAAISVRGNHTIERNVFLDHDCWQGFGSGVVTLADSVTADTGTVVRNNLFAGNHCAAVNTFYANFSTVINNTIVDNLYGVVLGGGGVARNNIVSANETGVAVLGVRTGATDHNVVASNGTDISGIASFIGQNGNVSADPLLADPDYLDFRPRPGSPAIDRGNPAGAPIDDLDATARPIDGDGDSVAVIDIGAIESDGTPIPPIMDRIAIAAYKGSVLAYEFEGPGTKGDLDPTRVLTRYAVVNGALRFPGARTGSAQLSFTMSARSDAVLFLGKVHLQDLEASVDRTYSVVVIRLRGGVYRGYGIARGRTIRFEILDRV